MAFTQDQNKAFEVIMSGSNTFITGGGGVGKTHVLNTVVRAFQRKGKQVMVCAPTGAAAVLVHGTTIHRGFGIPSGATINSKTMKIMARTTPSLRKADVVIIDEISMCRMDLFDAVAASLHKIEENDHRHVQLVVFGDFFQLSPVLTFKRGEKTLLDRYYGHDVGGAYAFMSSAWDSFHFICVDMQEVVRQRDDEFIANLTKARFGDATCLRYFNRRTSSHGFEKGIYLCGHKEEADRINNEALSHIPEESQTYNIAIDGEVEDSDLVVARSITLKPGALVTTIVNAPDGRYVNGSIGTIRKLELDFIYIDFESGISAGVSLHEWAVYDYKSNEDNTISKVCIGSYKQLPVRLAYASTIHKAQGATYTRVNLNPTCWAPGQLYVALSRVRKPGNLYLTGEAKPKDLVTDLEVLQFYRAMDKDTRINRNVGRPKQLSGSTKILRVSEEIAPDVQNIYEQWKALGPERYNYSIVLIPIDKQDKVRAAIDDKMYSEFL